MIKLVNIIRKGNKIYCDYYLDGLDEKYQLIIDIETETCECNSEYKHLPHNAMWQLLEYIESGKPLPKEDCIVCW